MRSFTFAVLAFASTGLVGPVVRFLTWPPTTLDETFAGRLSYFLYMFTLFLLPAGPVSVYAESKVVAMVLVVTVNVGVFAVAGLLVGIAARWPVVLAPACVAVIGLLLWVPLSRFPTGLDADLWFALVMALVVYAVPCWLVWRRRFSRAEQ